MRVSSLSVVARHPKGLDLHVRNLRWALEGLDYRINVFTFAGWGFDRTAYPDVNLVECPGDPMQFRGFWNGEIKSFLKESVDDVFVLVEQDQWFTRRLADLVRHAYETGDVVSSDESYGAHIMQGGRVVYPRIWEGGTIMRRDRIVGPILDHNIGLNARLSSDYVPEKLKSHPKAFIGGFPLGKFVKGSGYDTLIELCLYCFVEDVPVRREPILVHFNPTETVHQKFPELYAREVPWRAALAASQKFKLQNALFMFYVAGVCDLNDVVETVLRGNSESLMKKVKLVRHPEKWMSDEQLARFQMSQQLGAPRAPVERRLF